MIIDPTIANPAVDGAMAGSETRVREIEAREVEDILSDPSLSIEEKQAALQELADQAGLHETAGETDGFSPLRMQIGEALNMLADGGHSYVSPPPVRDETDPAAAPRSADAERPL